MHKERALKALCLVIFVLVTAPKISIKIGPVPFYLIDFLIIRALWYGHKLPKLPYKLPFKELVTSILIMIIVNELLNGIFIGTLLQPVYLTVRMTLAISLFFLVPKVIRDKESIYKLANTVIFGVIVTSLLLILSSLSFTRAFVTPILSSRFLMPNSESLYKTLTATSGVNRGTSLIGVSILSGAFLNVAWPLLLLLYNSYKKKGFYKRLLIFAIVLAPVGIVMTYSRGAILALLLIYFGIILFQKGKNRNLIITVLILAITVFSTIGWNSELFMFSRIENRMEATMNNPYEDERESERIMAYVEPLKNVIENPKYLLFGEGFAKNKVNTKKGNYNPYQKNRADHAVFAKAYYAYGMLTALLIIFLFFQCCWYTFIKIKGLPKTLYFSNKYVRIIFPILMGFSSWFSFGHAAVSQPRGAMLMFFVFGLVASQKNIFYWELNHLNKKIESVT